ELYGAAEEGTCTHHLGQRLQKAEFGLGFHAPNHLHHRRAFHQAVGIENDEVVVKSAGGLDEVGDVAGLLAGVGLPATVEDAAGVSYFVAHPRQPECFLGGNERIVRVGEDHEIEAATG